MPAKRLWKVTTTRGLACSGGSFRYDLPKGNARTGWIPGAWTPYETVRPCQSGYHLCRDEDLYWWIGSGQRIWLAEGRGYRRRHYEERERRNYGKVVVSSARLLAPTAWGERAARLLALELIRPYAHLLPTVTFQDALDCSFEYAMGTATWPQLQRLNAQVEKQYQGYWKQYLFAKHTPTFMLVTGMVLALTDKRWERALPRIAPEVRMLQMRHGKHAEEDRKAFHEQLTARLLFWMGVTD